MSDQKKSMVQLTGLWLNQSESGEKFFSGKLGSANVLIFKNKYKEKDNHPDYIMYAVQPKKKEDSSEGAAPSFNDADEMPF